MMNLEFLTIEPHSHHEPGILCPTPAAEVAREGMDGLLARAISEKLPEWERNWTSVMLVILPAKEVSGIEGRMPGRPCLKLDCDRPTVLLSEESTPMDLNRDETWAAPLALAVYPPCLHDQTAEKAHALRKIREEIERLQKELEYVKTIQPKPGRSIASVWCD